MPANLLFGLDDFREVVLLDTEYAHTPGEHVIPVALVAQELRSGQRHALFFEAGAKPACPLPSGDDVLYIAYAAQAEWATFLALSWELPIHVIDLFAEFRNHTNGLTDSQGERLEDSLVGALRHFQLPHMDLLARKDLMRELILRSHPFTQVESQQILAYCDEDVDTLRSLLFSLLPHLSLPFALFRGRYSKAVARMEFTGVPVDLPTLDQLRFHWDLIKSRLVESVEAEHKYRVYEGTHWVRRRFSELLYRIGLHEHWPRTATGAFTEEDDCFKTMALRFPVLQPLRDLRSTLVHLREIKVPVGSDARNRCSLSPFRSVTGRNYPATSRFIFGPSTWIRSLICPEAGRSLAYIDWVSAEFGIAAALSGDPAMIAAYNSGDVYMAFAIAAGAAPDGATKLTHPDVREIYKTVTLAVQYGQGSAGLARTLGKATWEADELLALHRRIYGRYWLWSECLQQRAVFSGKIATVFGWQMHVTASTKANTIANFPMQAHGAEILRWACIYATEAGVDVHAPVQDALLVGGNTDSFAEVLQTTQLCMRQASELVLDGFALRTDVSVVHHPERYVDKRGVAMWQRIMLSLIDLAEPALGLSSLV